MCEPTAVGRQPHIHIERYRDWRLAHESEVFYRDRARRSQRAACAAFIGMGTAHADPVVDIYADTLGVATAGDTVVPNDAYDMLFGSWPARASRTALLTWPTAQVEPHRLRGVHSPRSPRSKRTPVEHGLENLINALDPSAFYEQTTAGVVGTIARHGGAYLVPDTSSATWPRVWTSVC